MRSNKRFSRLIALLLSLVLGLSLCLPVLAAGEDEVVYIRTAEDLCALSEQCAYDAWSRGKTVVLTADLSLTGVDLEPIASFGGTSDGGGHTISGLTLTGSLSPAGLFLTVERGADHARRHKGIRRRYCRPQLRHDRGLLVLRRGEGRQRCRRHRRPQ